MHQAILLHADIHKSPEAGEIGDHTGYHHARMHFFNTVDVGKLHRAGFCTGIQAGFPQFAEDIPDREFTNGFPGITGRMDPVEQGFITS